MSPLQEFVAALLPKESATTIFALASLATGIPACIAWWITRRDRIRREDLTDEQRRIKELGDREAKLDGEQASWFAGLRAENTELRLEVDRAWKSSNRGWDLARYWHGTAHDVLRLYRNLRHNALNQQQWIQSAVRLMRDYLDTEGKPVLKMPEAIDPVPDRSPELPMGLEDPK